MGSVGGCWGVIWAVWEEQGGHPVHPHTCVPYAYSTLSSRLASTTEPPTNTIEQRSYLVLFIHKPCSKCCSFSLKSTLPVGCGYTSECVYRDLCRASPGALSSGQAGSAASRRFDSTDVKNTFPQILLRERC
jgi:hypothetical protein